MQIEEQNERDQQKYLMADSERNELIAALKKKGYVLTDKGEMSTYLGIEVKKTGDKIEMRQPAERATQSAAGWKSHAAANSGDATARQAD